MPVYSSYPSVRVEVQGQWGAAERETVGKSNRGRLGLL